VARAVEENDAVGVQPLDGREQRLGGAEEVLARRDALDHEVGNAGEVDQRARMTLGLRRAHGARERHFGAGGAPRKIDRGGDDVLKAADAEPYFGETAPLPRDVHRIGAGGVAAELAAHHLHAAVGVRVRGAGKADLIDLHIGQPAHQLGGERRAALPFDGVEDKKRDVSGGIGAQDVELHRDASLLFSYAA